MVPIILNIRIELKKKCYGLMDDPFLLISIQKLKDGMAKPYQIRQLLYFIEENNLNILE